MTDRIGASTIIADEDLARVTGGSLGMPGPGGIDMTNMDLESILALVKQQRQDQADASLHNQMSQIEQRNTTLTQMNGTLQELGNLEGLLDQQGSLSTDTVVHHLGAETTLGALAADLGLDRERVDDGSIDAEDMDMITDLLHDRIDSTTAAQEMDMAALQTMLDKRDDAAALMASFMEKMQNTRDAILGNIS